MPNKYGWLTMEEMLLTGLPYFSKKNDIGGWSSKAHSFAILISKSRCQQFKCPILANNQEKPSAYRYVQVAVNRYCFVPLYDRTEFYRSGNIGQKLLVDHEVMRFEDDPDET